mmetsp:Transcript_9186/g.24068  ORF Transcript_9186/g.24068 Transcript_9186/m.24068 type:complete len:664 (-) Transcript_9186:154-2145(-)
MPPTIASADAQRAINAQGPTAPENEYKFDLQDCGDARVQRFDLEGDFKGLCVEVDANPSRACKIGDLHVADAQSFAAAHRDIPKHDYAISDKDARARTIILDSTEVINFSNDIEDQYAFDANALAQIQELSEQQEMFETTQENDSIEASCGEIGNRHDGGDPQTLLRLQSTLALHDGGAHIFASALRGARVEANQGGAIGHAASQPTLLDALQGKPSRKSLPCSTSMNGETPRSSDQEAQWHSLHRTPRSSRKSCPGFVGVQSRRSSFDGASGPSTSRAAPWPRNPGAELAMGQSTPGAVPKSWFGYSAANAKTALVEDEEAWQSTPRTAPKVWPGNTGADSRWMPSKDEKVWQSTPRMASKVRTGTGDCDAKPTPAKHEERWWPTSWAEPKRWTGDVDADAKPTPARGEETWHSTQWEAPKVWPVYAGADGRRIYPKDEEAWQSTAQTASNVWSGCDAGDVKPTSTKGEEAWKPTLRPASKVWSGYVGSDEKWTRSKDQGGWQSTPSGASNAWGYSASVDGKPTPATADGPIVSKSWGESARPGASNEWADYTQADAQRKPAKDDGAIKPTPREASKAWAAYRVIDSKRTPANDEPQLRSSRGVADVRTSPAWGESKGRAEPTAKRTVMADEGGGHSTSRATPQGRPRRYSEESIAAPTCRW